MRLRNTRIYLMLFLSGLAPAERVVGQFGVGDVTKGKATAAVIGVTVAGAGVGIAVAYLALHHRGVATGCVTEAGATKAFSTGAAQSYALAGMGPTLTAGERYKLKGRMSGPASARSFRVDAILKRYGACP